MNPTDETTAINPKVAAGAGVGALSTVVLYALSQTGIEIPPEIASAATVLLMAGAGYLKKA